MNGAGKNGTRLAPVGKPCMAREEVELFATGATCGAIVAGLLACGLLICAGLASALQGVAGVAIAALCSAALFRFAPRTCMRFCPWVVVGNREAASSKGSPSSGLAHELRTELAIITLELDKLPGAPARAIREDVERLAGRIDSFARAIPPE